MLLCYSYVFSRKASKMTIFWRIFNKTHYFRSFLSSFIMYNSFATFRGRWAPSSRGAPCGNVTPLVDSSTNLSGSIYLSIYCTKLYVDCNMIVWPGKVSSPQNLRTSFMYGPKLIKNLPGSKSWKIKSMAAWKKIKFLIIKNWVYASLFIKSDKTKLKPRHKCSKYRTPLMFYD